MPYSPPDVNVTASTLSDDEQAPLDVRIRRSLIALWPCLKTGVEMWGDSVDEWDDQQSRRLSTIVDTWPKACSDIGLETSTAESCRYTSISPHRQRTIRLRLIIERILGRGVILMSGSTFAFGMPRNLRIFEPARQSRGSTPSSLFSSRVSSNGSKIGGATFTHRWSANSTHRPSVIKCASVVRHPAFVHGFISASIRHGSNVGSPWCLIGSRWTRNHRRSGQPATAPETAFWMISSTSSDVYLLSESCGITHTRPASNLCQDRGTRTACHRSTR